MVSKLGSGVALAAMLTMFGTATQAQAQVTGQPCSKAPLWANPEAGSNSALPVSSRYDIMYDLTGGTRFDMKSENGGTFDVLFCNPTEYDGAITVRYAYPPNAQESRVAPAQSCFAMRALWNLSIRGSSDWKACAFVRYRD